MTVYVHDFPGTRQELFNKILSEERIALAEVARKIRVNMEKRRIKIDPSVIHLFGVKSTRERVVRLLFPGQDLSQIQRTCDQRN